MLGTWVRLRKSVRRWMEDGKKERCSLMFGSPSAPFMWERTTVEQRTHDSVSQDEGRRSCGPNDRG